MYISQYPPPDMGNSFCLVVWIFGSEPKGPRFYPAAKNRNFEPRSYNEGDNSPNFRATQTGRRLATTYDLACDRPHTLRIFSGIGYIEPATLRSRGRDLTTRPPRPEKA
ncbi:hypothetical protein AVEN_207052-1 [Araneus ventricosus]|uniref:Uncharacterized protein n=1 Tax=Araneus ventricosus TaxID=182803 RepID=A0A4Y2K2G7_ARAVE|nr:hypothetical protein AVEN_207052-1 [Araneus ventricosus]